MHRGLSQNDPNAQTSHPHRDLSASCSRMTARCRTIRRCRCCCTKTPSIWTKASPRCGDRGPLQGQWLGARPVAQRHLSVRALPFDDSRGARHRAGPRQSAARRTQWRGVRSCRRAMWSCCRRARDIRDFQPATIFLSSAPIRPRAPIISAAATTRRIATRRSIRSPRCLCRQATRSSAERTVAAALAALAHCIVMAGQPGRRGRPG